MKETTQPPKDPKKKLWIGYAIILAIVILSNVFLFPALMQASVKSVNYSTFLQMLESKELATVQIEDQQIYFVDKNDNSYKTNAIAQDNNLVTRLEDAGVEFGTVYQSPTIWDSLLNLLISFLPMIILFWFVNRWASKKMQEMGGAGGNAMLFGGKSNKECRFACIGLGNCARACKFGAMHIVNGVAKVDRDKCVGCMACADACPKKIIEKVPYKQAVLVGCRNQDKGAVTRKICDVGCIGCMKCQRECPAEAIKIENFVSTIDYDKCVGCGHCADICPRGIISLMDLVKQ